MLPCNGCGYVRSIPGDAHSRCIFDWAKDVPGLGNIFTRSTLTPRTSQWFRFPFNFDPVWGPDTCPQRTEMADPEKIAPPNPWGDLVSLLR